MDKNQPVTQKASERSPIEQLALITEAAAQAKEKYKQGGLLPPERLQRIIFSQVFDYSLQSSQLLGQAIWILAQQILEIQQHLEAIDDRTEDDGQYLAGLESLLVDCFGLLREVAHIVSHLAADPKAMAAARVPEGLQKRVQTTMAAIEDLILIEPSEKTSEGDLAAATATSSPVADHPPPPIADQPLPPVIDQPPPDIKAPSVDGPETLQPPDTKTEVGKEATSAT